MGFDVSSKVHFLDSHLDIFSENLGALSDKQGDRLHHDIPTVEKRYQANWFPVCWLVIAAYLEEMFYGQNISAIYPFLHFR